MSAQLPTAIAESLRSRLPSQLPSDLIFRSLLATAAGAIKLEAKRAMNEATVEAAFERHLFTVLRAAGIDYAPVKEGRVKGTLLRSSGRTDSRFRNVVIEFKHRSEMTSASLVQKHKGQLEDYLQALGTKEKGEHIGFLTDGLKFLRSKRFSNGEIRSSGLEDLDDDGLKVFCRAIIASKASALTAENLVDDFCGSAFDGHLFYVAKALFDCIVDDGTVKTEMLRSEWESLFRLAHEDTSQQKKIQDRRAILKNVYDIDINDNSTEYLALFSLHTAYSIIVKLISFKVASDAVFGVSLTNFKELLNGSNDVLRAFMANLEEGELFRQIGVINLLEGDFFSWYSDKNQWNNIIAQCIKRVLKVLARYEDAKEIFSENKAIDLFRHLYEGAIPQVVRSSFGEFYTPLWLAQHVLDSSGYEDAERVLDPCCGSGTFLIAALQQMREENEALDAGQLLEKMLKSVVGIDLNPLAVLTARVHYFIYISDLIDRGIDVLIPVFLGDSSNLPSYCDAKTKSPYYSFEISTLRNSISVEIPACVAGNSMGLFKLMNEFELQVARKNYDAAGEIIAKFCDSENLSTIDTKRMEAIGSQIIALEKNNWNGIWARIIANFSSTVAIGKFERVVGNPPWIDWKSLPTRYRETVKELCIDKGLFSGARRTGGINLNICALITHVAAVNWLKPSGSLAFLMPRELAVQPSYEGWRRSVGGAGCRLATFHDWSDAGHPFEPVREDFMTFVIQRKSGGSDLSCHSYKKIDRKEQSWKWEDMNEAMEKLAHRKRYARAVIPGSTAISFADTKGKLSEYAAIAGTAGYIGREGIEFYPQELMMFRFVSKGKRKGEVIVENFQGVKSKYKIPKQKVLLETKYLFPLVKGPHITPYEYEENDLLVAFPYKKNDPHRPIDQATLLVESPLLLAHFIKFQEQISAQTAYSDSLRQGGEFYGVARTGPYSFAENYVAFRDNTKWAACVVSKRMMPWGEQKRYLFQNHAVSICEDENRNFISEDEAHYIASIMNSEIVYEFIHASSDERSFKIRTPIKMPKYDSMHIGHRELVKLSRNAHDDEDIRQAAAKAASAIYVKLCAAIGS